MEIINKILGKTEDIFAPFSGKVIPLSEVPDHAYSNGTMGNGIAINPESDTLLSPVDGIVVTLFPTNHAIAIETEHGLQILIHVGINSVSLLGKGFTPLVYQGDTVKKGQPLLKLDLEFLRANTSSMISPITFPSVKEDRLIVTDAGEVVAGEDVLVNVKF